MSGRVRGRPHPARAGGRAGPARAVVAAARGARARVPLALVGTALVACATAPAVPPVVYVEPEPFERQGVVALEVAALPEAGPLDFTVSFDGRPVRVGDGARRELAVRAGALFVDVVASRLVEDPRLADTLVPQRQLVPCGRGRVCERTVLVPRDDVGLRAPVEQEICRRGVELEIREGATHRVHVSSDGRALCRVVCTRVDAATGVEEDCLVE